MVESIYILSSDDCQYLSFRSGEAIGDDGSFSERVFEMKA